VARLKIKRRAESQDASSALNRIHAMSSFKSSLSHAAQSHAPITEARPVWDRFIRVFHWSLVLCVVANYFVLEDEKTLHQWVGYLASALVAARIVWGFVGSPHARFSDFFPTPRRVWRHVRQLAAGKADMHWGHNPVGALMMLALMGLVLALGVSGWMQGLDAFWGDEQLQAIHEFLGNALIALAGLHALAAIVMGRLERTRLVSAMFTGVKQHW
jgi:cytochrome b